MSLLTVTGLTHGFGDRAIFNNVSFRLLKGEHIGLIGANGEGKSTFMKAVGSRLEKKGLNIGLLKSSNLTTGKYIWRKVSKP